VKPKALLLFISFAFVQTVYSFGQVDCTTSTKLVCEFPFSAQFLANNSVGSSRFISAINGAATPINISIATQLTQLPVPSASVGVVTIRDKGSDVGRPFDNLGPILTDRPDPVGKNHLFIGSSFQQFNFNALDGVGLGALPVGFSFQQTPSGTSPCPGTTADCQTFYGGDTNNINFQLNQYAELATYGLTNRTDVSVVVPINQISLRVASSNFQSYFYDSVTNQFVNVHPVSAATSLSTKGSASGIGDVTVSLKELLLGSEGSRTAIAVGAGLRFPSGDALNYLGSGAFGGNLYGLFEYRWKVAPHLKLSYQWNNTSQLMDLSKAGNTARLPGGLQYDGGADIRIKRPLTLALDVMGNQFVNTPSFTLTTTNFPASPQSPYPSYVTVSNPVNTYTTVNFSSGLKYLLGRHFLLYGNVLIQANNVGLRSDPVPLFGLAFKR
jgi:hypothetical protein